MPLVCGPCRDGAGDAGSRRTQEGEGSDGRGPPDDESGGRSAGLGQNEGAGPVARFWAVQERKRKEKRKKKWAGWAEKERGKRKAFPFLKRFKHIQFKFELIRIQI